MEDQNKDPVIEPVESAKSSNLNSEYQSSQPSPQNSIPIPVSYSQVSNNKSQTKKSSKQIELDKYWIRNTLIITLICVTILVIEHALVFYIMDTFNFFGGFWFFWIGNPLAILASIIIMLYALKKYVTKDWFTATIATAGAFIIKYHSQSFINYLLLQNQTVTNRGYALSSFMSIISEYGYWVILALSSLFIIWFCNKYPKNKLKLLVAIILISSIISSLTGFGIFPMGNFLK
jgi:uncharacterized membrane protein